MSIWLSTEISVVCKTRDGVTRALRMAPEEFFEIDSEANQAQSIEDLVWRHNHPNEYLDIHISDMVEGAIDVYCRETGERVRDIDRVWDNGRARCVSRTETIGGKESYWLKIIELQTSDGIHFLKFGSDSLEECSLLEHNRVTPDDGFECIFPADPGQGNRI